MSSLCAITVIESRDNSIMQTVMQFSLLLKECQSRAFQILWTIQAEGNVETEQEGTAC